MSTHIRSSMYFLYLLQVTGSMAGVVKSMESAMKSMNLEKVRILIFWAEEGRVINPCHAEYFYAHCHNFYHVNLQYSVVCMYFQSELKTVWILICWLLMKSADLDQQ